MQSYLDFLYDNYNMTPESQNTIMIKIHCNEVHSQWNYKAHAHKYVRGHYCDKLFTYSDSLIIITLTFSD